MTWSDPRLFDRRRLQTLCRYLLVRGKEIKQDWKFNLLAAVEFRRAHPHLVGVVSADVAERGGSRLAEQRGGVALQSVDADVFRVQDVGERRLRLRLRRRRRREHGRGPGRGGGGGREVGQALRQAVHVDLDL